MMTRETSGGTSAEQRQLVSEEVAAAIVAEYERGDKVLDIERRHNVPRSTMYWVLKKAGVSPSRAKSTRLRGSAETLATLYEVIEKQAERIKELEAQLGVNPDRDIE